MRKVISLLVFVLLLLISVPTYAGTVQNVHVSIYPLIAGMASQYNIDLTVSSSGALQGGTDRIKIVFPSETYLPSKIDSGKILLNGTSVSSSYIVVDSNVLTIKLPSSIDISNSGYLGIVISASAGIRAPREEGTYNLKVYTSQDGVANSNSYIIEGIGTSDISVSLTPATVSEYGAYEFSFTTGARGALEGNEDYIYIEFPAEVTLPDSVSSSRIRINGKNPASGGSVDSSTNTLSIKVPSGTSIDDDSTVKVEIDSGAKIRNPKYIGDYYIRVYTSQESLYQEGIYSVGMTVSTPIVMISPNRSLEPTQYSISFTTSSQGVLEGGKDYIYLYFPSGTYIPSSISRSYITINGYEPSSVSCSKSEGIITLRVPSGIDIKNSTYVGIVIKSQGGIKNPEYGGNYKLEVSTTSDRSRTKSQEYTVSGPVVTTSRPSVIMSTYKTGENPQIIVKYKNDSSKDLSDGDTITLIFPDEYTFPSSINRSYITINDEVIDDYEISGKRLVLTLTDDTEIDSGEELEVKIKSDAGIQNPTTSGNYSLEFYTSRESTRVESNSFYITKTSYQNPIVEISNKDPGIASNYIISFFAGTELELISGDKIQIQFPQGTVLPEIISRYQVFVNNQEVDSIVVDGRTAALYLSERVTAAPDDKILILLTEQAGIKNPTLSGEYTLNLSIPRNDIERQSLPYQIGSGSQAQGTIITFRVGSKLQFIGSQVINLDTAPTIINSFTVVPLRALGDALGAETSYNSSANTVTVKTNNKEIVFIVNSKLVKVGDEWINLDVPATLINNRVMIPVRFVSQNFGAVVDWNQTTQEIKITK